MKSGRGHEPAATTVRAGAPHKPGKLDDACMRPAHAPRLQAGYDDLQGEVGMKQAIAACEAHAGAHLPIVGKGNAGVEIVGHRRP